MTKKLRIQRGFLFALLAVLVLGLAGCGKDKQPDDVFIADEPEDMGEGAIGDESAEAPSGETGSAAETAPAEEPQETQPPANVEMSSVTAPDADTDVYEIVLGVGSDETQAIVKWYGTNTEAGTVYVAKAAEMGGNTFPVTAQIVNSTVSPADYQSYMVNAATVTGLERDTEYCYMVGSANGWSSLRSFHTGKEGQADIIVTGDIQLGTGDNDGENVAAWNRIVADTVSRFPDYNMHLNMGDVTTMAFEDHYVNSINNRLFSDYVTGVVYGNHDAAGDLWNKHFSQPNQSDFAQRDGKANGNFWFKYNGVLFMELNYQIEDIDILVDHKYFIEQTIAANPDCKWRVVLMHYSPFSSVAKYQDYSDQNREYWLQVFEEYDIDVVLNGHDHAYTRSYMIQGGQPQKSDATSVTNPEGILYVTFGSASGSQYHDVNPTGYAAKTLQTYTPHVSTVNFTQNSFKLTVYDANSWEVLDSFEIIKE